MTIFAMIENLEERFSVVVKTWKKIQKTQTELL